MTDPFAVLRDELVRAAAVREPAPAPARGRGGWERLTGRLGRRSHPLVIVLGTLLVSGSATAGVIALTESSSQPLAGTVPGRVEAASLAGYHYSISVTPNLGAGEAFWNTSILYNKNGRFGSGEGGGSLYATRSNPLFGGVGVSISSTPPRGDTVGYVMTAPYVLAVRVGDRTIRTFSSPDLPAGDRAAVLFLPAGYPNLVMGWRPGQPIRSHETFPPLLGHRPITIRTIAILPIDRNGNVIATSQRMPFMPFASFWQARSAVTPNITESPYHGPTRPLPGACELARRGLRALTPEWGHVINVIPSYPDAVGALLVSCVDTEYYLHGWGLEAAVLLDARRPGRVLATLRGAQPVAGHPGTVNAPDGGLTARRIGNAWLVVQGGSGLAQRLQALSALRIGKLDLRRVSAGG
jgi:hypothetical protein